MTDKIILKLKSTLPGLGDSKNKDQRMFYLLGAGIVIGAALSLYNLAVIVLFINLYTPDYLPLCFFVAGLWGIICTWILTQLQRFVGFSVVASNYFLVSAILMLGLSIGLDAFERDGVYYRWLVWLSLVGMMSLNRLSWLVFEGFFARLFSGQSAKRKTGTADVGMVSAGVFVWLLLPWLTYWDKYKLDSLLFYGAFFLLITFGLLLYLAVSNEQLNVIREDLKEIKNANNPTALWQNDYTRLLVKFVLLSSMAGIAIEFLYFSILEAKYLDIEKTHLTRIVDVHGLVVFVGIFGAIIGFFNIFLRAFAYRYLINQNGLRNSLLILPLLLLVFVGFAWLATLSASMSSVHAGNNSFFWFFVIISLTKLLFDALSEAVQTPVLRVYLMPVDFNLRFDLQVKLEGITTEIGVVLAGILLGFLGVLNELRLELPIILGLIVGMMIAGFRLHDAYLQMLENRLKQGQIRLDADEHQLRLDIVQQLHKEIPQLPSALLDIHLNLLSRLDPIVYRQVIVRLLDDSNQSIQAFIHNTLSKKLCKILREKYPALTANDWQMILPHNLYEMIWQGQLTTILTLENTLRNWLNALEAHISASTDIEDLHRNALETLREESGNILKEAPLTIRACSFNLTEDVFMTAVRQAGELCILEAIPYLDIVLQSRYLPFMTQAEVIRSVYQRLRGAEFRLERVKYIRQLLRSKQIEERIFGALITNYAAENIKIELLNQLFFDELEILRYYALIASLNSTNKAIHQNLIQKLDEPAYSNVAAAVLEHSCQYTFPALKSAFSLPGQSERVLFRIILIYAKIASQPDYVGRSEEALEQLILHLDHLNQNIRTLVLDTFRHYGFKIPADQKKVILQKIEEIAENLLWNLSAQADLSDYDISEALRDALQGEIDENYEKIFSLFSLLYGARTVELVEKSWSSGNPEAAALAQEQLQAILSDKDSAYLQPKLLPLLDRTTTTAEKIEILEEVLPMRRMDRATALFQLIQRDYNRLNRWTKACALAELASQSMEEKSDISQTDIFSANIVNPDLILSELAYKSLYDADRANFYENVQRFQSNRRYLKNDVIGQGKSLLDTQGTISHLKFDWVRFFRQVNEFRAVSGVVLSEIAKICELHTIQSGEKIASFATIRQLDYFVVYTGTVTLKSANVVLQSYTQGSLVHNWQFLNQKINAIDLIAESEAVIFRLSQVRFHELMAFYAEIPQSILRYNQQLYQALLLLQQAGKLAMLDSFTLEEMTKIATYYAFTDSKDSPVISEDAYYCVLEATAKGENLPTPVLWEGLRQTLQKGEIFTFERTAFERTYANLSRFYLLRQIPEWQEIAEFTLWEIATQLEAHTFRAEALIADFDTIQAVPFVFLAEGTAILTLDLAEKTNAAVIATQTFLNPLRYLSQNQATMGQLIAQTNCVVYRFPPAYLTALMRNYEPLPMAMLRYYYPTSLHEIVRFIRPLSALQGYDILQIIELSTLIQAKEYEVGDKIGGYAVAEEMDYFVVYAGNVELQYGKGERQGFGAGDFFPSKSFAEGQATQIRIMASEDCLLYKIPLRKYSEWRSVHSLHYSII
jgi:hypothetical protein